MTHGIGRRLAALEANSSRHIQVWLRISEDEVRALPDGTCCPLADVEDRPGNIVLTVNICDPGPDGPVEVEKYVDFWSPMNPRAEGADR